VTRATDPGAKKQFFLVRTSRSIVLLLWFVTRRKAMTNTAKLVLIAAISALSIASPALAQSRDDGREAFGMVPADPTFLPANDPAYTGGGSHGYNEGLLKNQW
jgi:hypothetical protein